MKEKQFAGRLKMSYRNLNEKKEEEENDIVKNYQGSLAKSEKKKKSGGFQSMGTLSCNQLFSF